MPGKYEKKKKRNPVGWLLGFVLALAAAWCCIAALRSIQPETADTLPSFRETEITETTGPVDTTADTGPQGIEMVAKATIAAQGDLLMHATFFQEKYQPACRKGEGEYDFSSIFRYVSEYVSQADYAVANLETTLGGDAFPYQGNPSFNCPDPILDAMVEAGYDLLLTANNHSYDTLMTGIDRTLEKTREQGLDTLGTRLSQEEPRYQIREINGIKIGMICYTYTLAMEGGRPRLNDNSTVENPEQINFFSYNDLGGFYEEIGTLFSEMKAQGAEATMLFIHWGTEYEIRENGTQQKIAQKMCDLGFDVIVGGHPHVVQPMALLTGSEDPEHKTVCIYSLGNAVSNQRRELMRLNTGHTEDGAVFSVTFEKYSDGSVVVADLDVLPTWVNLYTNSDGRQEYNILPLEQTKQPQWETLFGVSPETAEELSRSYQRTMDILGAGLEECREYLYQRRITIQQ